MNLIVGGKGGETILKKSIANFVMKGALIWMDRRLLIQQGRTCGQP